MKYIKFIIQGYRGISDITEINISKESLIPIIGKNESGKTTCLEAILSFDYTNDANNGARHLLNVDNLYSTEEPPVTVSAEIEIDKSLRLEEQFSEEIEIYKSEFLEEIPDASIVIEEIPFNLDEESDYRFENWEYIRAIQILNSEFKKSKNLLITRDLKTKTYSILQLIPHITPEVNNSICKQFVNLLPYTLYFDDFRDRLEEKIFITEDKSSDTYSNWIPYIDELFKQTKNTYSVFNIPDKTDGIRRSIVKEVL